MKSDKILCLGQLVPANHYTKAALPYLSKFPVLISIQELWNELDRVWDDCLLKHNNSYTDDFFADFYTHPVWCLNSVFSAVDPVSTANREALIGAIDALPVDTVVDMGGGYGAFLKMLKKHSPQLSTILCEPYIDQAVASELAKNQILISRQIPVNADAYIFVDVLEHLTSPLSYLAKVIKNGKRGSFFIFGNCFYPFIKCHLPSTFYLRHSFHVASRLLGLVYIDHVKSAEYLQIYRLQFHSPIHPWIVALIARIYSYSRPRFYKIYSAFKKV